MADPTMKLTGSGFTLPADVQRDIWQTTAYESAFMQLVPQIALPGNGVRVPIINGDPEAAWVAETGEKPKSGVTFSSKDMAPHTLAVILPFSNQFRDTETALYDQVAAKGPQAIARAFDKTIMGALTAPGSDFDTLAAAPTVSLGSTAKSVWTALNTADDQIAAADGELDGWALSPQGRSLLRQATDNNGRPLFLESTAASDVATLLGQPVRVSRGVHTDAVAADETAGTAAKAEVVGVAGDFASASWGSVDGIQTSISDQATLTIDGAQVNLWERNMFAVRIEIEVGFRIRDINRFALLTV